MNLRPSHRVLAGAAMIALATQAQAAQARIGYICPELNKATGELSVRVDSGCTSSSARLISQDLALEVDQSTASIHVTGDMKFGGGMIQTADCMGRQDVTLSAEGIEARRYTLTYEGQYLATLDMMEQAKPDKCLSPTYRHFKDSDLAMRSSFKAWNADPVEGWSEWRGDSVYDALSPVLDSHPEGMEGRASAEITVEKKRWRREPSYRTPVINTDPFIAVTITQHGYLDDSVSGGRFFAEMRQDENGKWMVAGLWSQNMCARGDKAGQWTGARCP